MKRLLASIAAVFLLAAPARADWPPAAWSGGGAQSSKSNPAVVRIVAPGRDSVSYGSGSLIAKSDKHGLIVTNWHVINEATGQIVVRFPDGFSSAGTVIKVDQDWDLAALAIWRPAAEPLPLATAAPQPGEMLTIAGYGSGNFRMASGQCTQYVAPGNNFPFEMVELATTARQGDSGGPILNSRGELAGVLFGEGGGRTAGSYCGRVQWFLTGLLPAQLDGPHDTMLAGAGQPQAMPPAAPRTAFTNRAAGPAQPGARVASLAALGLPQAQRTPSPPPAARPMAPATSFASANRPIGAASEQNTSGWQSSAPRGLADPQRDPFRDRDLAETELTDVPRMRAIPDTVALGPTSETTTYPASGQADSREDRSSAGQGFGIGWTDIAGDTIGEQCKSVLATVGGLAIALRTIGWMSRGKAKADKDEDEEDEDDDDDDDDDDD